MNQKLLKRTLTANAAFSGLAGLDALVFSRQLAAVFGHIQPLWFLGLGAGLLLFAAHLLWSARRDQLTRPQAYYFVASDFTWVLASLVLLASGALGSGLAVALVATVALIVLGFGVAQYSAATTRSC